MDPSWRTAVGADPRPALAGRAEAAMADLRRGAWESADPQLLELARIRLAMLLRNPEAAQRGSGTDRRVEVAKRTALSSWPTSPLFSATERAVLAFTEQFVIDVAGTSDADRDQLFTHLAPEAVGGFVMALFTMDYDLRTEMAIARLFDVPSALLAAADERPGSVAAASVAAASVAAASVAAGALAAEPGVSEAAGDIAALFMTLLRTIALMSTLDPVTTELVRLRGARAHNCRICQSTRSVRAIDAGATEAMFDQVTSFEHSDLAERHKVALALTDAIITQPSEITDELVNAVRSQFTPAEAIELVYDVLRNSSQKVAVSLAADAPNVTEGVEYYDLDERGEVLFGQPTPAAL